MNKKITLVKFFMFAGNILVPCYAIAMCILFKRTFGGISFALFISAMIMERAWETFKTSKEQHREEFHGDWTLAVVTFSYLFLFILTITEFYLFKQSSNIYLAALGVILLGSSFRMRFWGMAALGKQWAVHAVGAQKIRKVRIVKVGPYKYIRHPIYLGIIFEELSYPLIANANYALFFAAFVCIPLVVIRALTEEKFSVRRFGEKYLSYKKEVGMLFPVQLLKNNGHSSF
ncbi:MAG: isoprenylcysteine carboxylmethyltransferase family protein [Candidatus Omnitrophota bacterium]|nr:isoprenylcysteine carboxylmethyltransferase family protein [Candidatus Omnitrophota bacterium]